MTPRAPRVITDRLVRQVLAAVADGAPVRRSLPRGGQLYIDRQVPFLCVYRRPVSGQDQGTDKLVTCAAAFLAGSRHKDQRQGQGALLRGVVGTLQEKFGALLLLEVTAHQTSVPPAEQQETPPVVRVLCSQSNRGHRFVEVLRDCLAQDRRMAAYWQVEVVAGGRKGRRAPPLSASEALELGCTQLVVELPPLYRGPDGVLFPVVLRNVRRVLDQALRKTVYEFARTRTKRRPRTYQALGRRALVRVVWRVDERLADLARSYDFLLAMTPVNITPCWNAFRRGGFEQAPDFRYRPLTVDVSQAKRQLFSIPIERIEDPAVADLLLEKQLELDRQLTILADRGSRRVLYGSLQLYGRVDDALLREAEAIIERIPPGARERGGRAVTAQELARRVDQEIALYRARVPGEQVTVEIREDIASGMMVSGGRLLVGTGVAVNRHRVEALVQHEVGTHLLTYLNGRAQRFQQLSVGLANYDETQEGLAVLAEYFCGGMSRPRLRLLAGRVFAARALVRGASFVDTFRLLLRYGFSERIAYSVVARTFRGGGLTKDAIYLRGLCGMLDYLRAGEPLELFFVGKIARQHVGIVRALQARGILTPPPLAPRYLEDPLFNKRLERLRKGARPFQLAEKIR